MMWKKITSKDVYIFGCKDSFAFLKDIMAISALLSVNKIL